MDLLQDYGSDNSSKGGSDRAMKRQRKEEDEAKPQTSTIEIVSSKDVVASETFVRSTPPVVGNWAGHVFAPIGTPSPNETAWKEALMKSVLRFRHSLEEQQFPATQIISHVDITSATAATNKNDNHKDEDLSDDEIEGFSSDEEYQDDFFSSIHVSLSRPFALQLPSMESFVEKLQSRLQHFPPLTLAFRPSHARVLVNDSGTRSFWVWPMDTTTATTTSTQLLAMVQEINAVLGMYNQPPYYDPPIFHISLASVVGNVLEKNPQEPPPAAAVDEEEPLFRMRLTQIHCDFGGNQRLYKINLQT